MSGPIYSGGDGTSIYSAPIKPYTFTTKPATAAIGDQIYITDIGEYGAIFTWNGSQWTHSGAIEIMQRGKGWIVPSLAAANAATYSQSGTTITVTSAGHNIPANNYDTKDVYLAMGAAATGATIPPGWFSNFTRTGVDTFTCVSTVSQTGTGAVNTNIAETFIPDLTATIKGGVLGLNGATDYAIFASNNSNADVKTATLYYGTVAIPYTSTTNVINGLVSVPISNRNSFTSQFTIIGNGSNIGVISNNTSIDFTCTFSVQSAAANDYSAIHAASIYIRVS